MHSHVKHDSALAHPLRRLREIERKVPRTIVRIERKLIDFPFRKYFIGHKKPDKPKHKPNWRTWKNDQLTLAWLGQSTVLINFFGTWILTDPVFSKRCGVQVGPFAIGPRRIVNAPLRIDDLPPIDLILISHAHMDHTDPPSLRKLTGAKHVIVAANTLKVYRPFQFKDVQELDWRNTLVLSAETPVMTAFDNPTRDTGLRAGEVRIEALEVRHAGWRMPWDPCRSRNEKNGFSYNGYLVETRDSEGHIRSFVFCGDTGYTPLFGALGDRMRVQGREIECAIVPIGTYNPWVESHCNPEQAWRMTEEMEARVIVPVHWNTFTQSSEPRDEPMHWLQSIVDDDDRIALTEHGETWSSPGAEQPVLSAGSLSSASRPSF